jgi:hypothetical protein
MSNTTTPTKSQKVIRDALGGGIPGMVAMLAQVTSLMWLRTTMNYQYTYGTNMTEAMRRLYREGGIRRFYTGYSMALLQGPLSRFGDTAANAGTLSLLELDERTRDFPLFIKTLLASMNAAVFRILLMPIDTCKTMLQVNGKNGWQTIANKVRAHGVGVLYYGSLANATATLAGHYPWYTTHNYLSKMIPEYKESLALKLSRSAGIGFCASVIADTISNSFRVVKTARQAAANNASYQKVIQNIIAQDGMLGLLGRGLKTRLLTNAIQGTMFSVCWRLGQDYWVAKDIEKDKEL